MRASRCPSSFCWPCRWRCWARWAWCRCADLSNDVYCQIGLVMLIGLSAKNSILIVEFAEQLRRKGRSIAEAAIEAAELRLRPILMTSFAFILGVLPLVFATGAGALGRRSVGTTDRRRHAALHGAEPVLYSRALRDSEQAAEARRQGQRKSRRRHKAQFIACRDERSRSP